MTKASHIEHPFAWLAPRLRSVEVLWGRGHSEESYALLKQSLDEALHALERERQAPPVLVRELEQLVAQSAVLEAPERLDAAHGAYLARVRSVCLRLQGVPEQPPRTALWITLLVSALAAALYTYSSRTSKLEATASAEYAEEFAARNAVDGVADTEWLLPGGELGYLDIELSRTRSVSVVSITNAHNRHFLDRGIKKGRIEVYDDDERVDKVDIAFAKIESKHSATRFKLKGKRGNRVRIEVLEFHSLGGGLAEVKVD
jgi:hypothetical protein